LEHLISQLRTLRTGIEPRAPGAWVQREGNPFSWRLAHDPIYQATPATPDANALDEVARHCLALVSEGTDAARKDVLTRAIHLHAADELRRAPDLIAAMVRAAFQGRTSRQIEQAVAEAALMVAAPVVEPIDIVWLSSASLELAPPLRELEPAVTQKVAQFMEHDDAGLTTRLVFGKPVRWNQVLSLKDLFKD
jgi:hypothetical protein